MTCPVCLDLDCQVEHRECSPTKPECIRCGLTMREPANGLCGFCIEETTNATEVAHA